MACFLVPAGEAVVVTIVKKVEESKEPAAKEADEAVAKIPFSQKLKWLTNLLWGGAILLAFEHLWHGEVVPFPPFLSAMNDPGDTAEMLHEMGTVGVTMAIIITAVWVVMCFAADAIVKRPDAQKQNA
ncbi:MAG: hypothetical protein K6B14_06075 [Lachnospiraceae bacterium]|nr:hypothetical protein [Lachnospiraceae bacterium]